MSQNYSWPAPPVTATNPSVSSNNATAPTSSTQIGIQDSTGKLQAVVEGQTTSAKSIPVVLASDQSNLTANQGNPNTAANGWPVKPTDGTNTITVKPASTAAVATDTAEVVALSPNTPLPAGTNTIGAVTQASGPWSSNITEIVGAAPSVTNSLPTRITNGTAFVDPTQIRALTSADVVTADQGGTWNITNISGTVSLPTGAATSANQTTIINQTAHLPAALGQTTMSASLPVTLASDQTELPASKGRAQANVPARNVYSSTNVTTTAFVQLVASTASATSLIEVFDSSGQTMALATGAAGSEVIQCYIFPGGQGQIPISIAAGTRVSIEAVSANATTGEIDINFWQ